MGNDSTICGFDCDDECQLGLSATRVRGYIICFLRVPQLYCSFPAAQAGKGSSQEIVCKPLTQVTACPSILTVSDTCQVTVVLILPCHIRPPFLRAPDGDTTSDQPSDKFEYWFTSHNIVESIFRHPWVLWACAGISWCKGGLRGGAPEGWGTSTRCWTWPARRQFLQSETGFC